MGANCCGGSKVVPYEVDEEVLQDVNEKKEKAQKEEAEYKRMLAALEKVLKDEKEFNEALNTAGGIEQALNTKITTLQATLEKKTTTLGEKQKETSDLCKEQETDLATICIFLGGSKSLPAPIPLPTEGGAAPGQFAQAPPQQPAGGRGC